MHTQGIYLIPLHWTAVHEYEYVSVMMVAIFVHFCDVYMFTWKFISDEGL